MANTLDKVKLDAIRAYSLADLQTLNFDATTELANGSRLDSAWVKLKGHGKILAAEMTNLINTTSKDTDALYCDARKWVNKEVAEKGKIHEGNRQINSPIAPKDVYRITVEYNSTSSADVKRSGGTDEDQHFFNLILTLPNKMFAAKKYNGTPLKDKYGNQRYFPESVQLAHLSIFTLVSPGKTTETGFCHLKDNLGRGELLPGATASDPSTLNPAVSSPHVRYIPGKKGTKKAGKVESRIFSYLRRYIIYVEKDASGNITGFKIGLQKQDGPVSQMAITFNEIVMNVLQQYFNAGFSIAGFATKPNRGVFTAENDCKAAGAAAYNEATSKGAATNVPAPADQTTLPFVGGKRKKLKRKTRRLNRT